MTSKDIKTVELIVNSDQAKAKLEELNKKLDTMKQKREDALNRGDSKALSVYTREVNKLEKEIQRIETRAQGMSKALANLEKSTFYELNVPDELNTGKIERGSKEWGTLTEAIRSTKCFVPVGSEFINKNKVPHGINPLQHLTFICYCCGDPIEKSSTKSVFRYI